jgi:hypothetical protein
VYDQALTRRALLLGATAPVPAASGTSWHGRSRLVIY